MIAVIKVGGHQAIVQEGEKYEVDKLNVEVGKKITFETLLVSEPDGKNFQVGTPILKDVVVEAKVIDETRGAKIRVFKMKPRKRYRQLYGHRQDFSVIEITKIGAGAAAKKAAPAAEKKRRQNQLPPKNQQRKNLPPPPKKLLQKNLQRKRLKKKSRKSSLRLTFF